MKINHDLFYRDLVSEEDRIYLYNCSLEMVALITGIVKASGGRLAVARVGTNIHLVDKAEGFMVLKLAMSISETKFSIDSPHTNLLKRSANRNCMVSKNIKRLVTALKGNSISSGVTLIESIINNARQWRMVDQIRAAVICAHHHYITNSHYASMLDGSEQFALLDVLLGDFLFSGVSVTQQEKYRTIYAAHCKQRENNNIAQAKMTDIFAKPLWVFSLSALGLIVGCAAYSQAKLDEYELPNVSLETRNVLVPFTLYKDVHSIPDVALREEIITILTMAKVNRANNPKYVGLTYADIDRDNFFPLGDKLFADSQSITITNNEHIGPKGFGAVITFIIPR